MAYHAFPRRLPGGFVGVDIFFVISGYLITHQLLQTRDLGLRSLRAFYARRMRRIIPAGAVVLIATLFLARIRLGPLGAQPVSGDGRAVALFYPNIHFATQATDYLANPKPSPLLHYWSLGVEEQFYLLWPALIIGVTALATRRRRASVILLVVTGVSLAASVVLTPRTPSWAFFGLHTRAWEFGFGGLLTLAAPRLQARLRPPSAAMLTLVGLVAIASSSLALGPSVPFPGWVALLPVAGAAAVIAGSLEQSPLDGVLALPPLQWCGDISYSLYLWHWPLIVLFAGSSHVRRLAVLALAVALAHVTYRLVETPIRRQRWLAQLPERSYAFGAALMAAGVIASVLAGALPRLDAGAAVRPGGPEAPAPQFVPSNLHPKLAGADFDRPASFSDGCVVGFGNTTSPECTYGPSTLRRTIVLFGDSHAGQWASALTTAAVGLGYRVTVLTKASCPPADVLIYLSIYRRAYTECQTWRAWALNRIAQLHPSLVVVSGARSYGYPGVSHADFLIRQERGLERTLGTLVRESHVLLVADTPQFPTSPAVCLAAHLHSPARCGASATVALAPAYSAVEREAAAAVGADFVSFNSIICPDEFCDPIHGDLLLYADENHLSRAFADSLEPMLAARVEPILASS